MNHMNSSGVHLSGQRGCRSQAVCGWFACVRVSALLGAAVAFGLVGTWRASPALGEPSEATETSETVVETVTVRETTTTRRVEKAESQAPIAAIFIKNRAHDRYDKKVMALEDLISSRVTDLGLSVISREDVINAVSSFSDEGANAGDENLPGADLDALMSNQSSATRLAQMLGADFVMVGSIVSVNHNARTFEGYGTKRSIFESRMRVTYKILDRLRGASITGGTVAASHKAPFQRKDGDAGHTYAESTGVIDELLNDVSEKLAEQFESKLAKVEQRAPADVDLAEWTVICGTTDMVVPTIVENEDGEFVVGEQSLPINPMNVTVELNGAVIGTAPGTFEVAPGLSKLRLTREGYRDFERTVNVVDGQTLRIDLKMTDKEYARWKDMTAFLQNLKQGAQLTDAQAERVRGCAQMLRQSGFKVDHKAEIQVDQKSDVKVDTTEAVNIHRHGHVWQAVPVQTGGSN